MTETPPLALTTELKASGGLPIATTIDSDLELDVVAGIVLLAFILSKTAAPLPPPPEMADWLI